MTILQEYATKKKALPKCPFCNGKPLTMEDSTTGEITMVQCKVDTQWVPIERWINART